MVTCRVVVAVALLIAVAGCSGGGGSNNHRPEPLILEPHEESTHLPGDVDFEGRAVDDEDGPLASASMTWQILDTDGDIVGAFQGAVGTISVLVPGDYTAVLIAEDSKGKSGTYEQPFHIGNTIARIDDPDNEQVIPISQPFDVDGIAQTVAPGTELATMTFVGIDRATDSQVFSLPVVVPPGNTMWSTTVTPSVAAGRFRVRLDVTTTNVAESAQDNINVLADAAPVVAITSPANGTTVAPGASLQFSGTVSDAGGGTPTLEWASSLAGPLSSQLEFTSNGLVRAKHRITLTATDENGLQGTASVDVYIEDAGSPLLVSAPSLPSADVRAVAVEPGSPDLVWAGTAAGLASYSADSVALVGSFTSAYNTNGNGPATSADCISTGECLLGIAGNGVSIRDAANTAWSTYNPPTGNEVRGVAESAAGPYLFFATDQGLTRTDLNRANAMAFDTGALNEVILAVAVDDAGAVWAGTDGAGLVRLVLPSTTSVFDAGDGLGDDVVNAVAIRGDGTVWVGTDAGVTRFDPVTSTFTRWRNELPSDTVNALAFNGDVLWIATQDGAARFDPDAELWTYFGESDLPGRVVHDVAVDGAGSVWLAVGANNGTGGLVRYDGP